MNISKIALRVAAGFTALLAGLDLAAQPDPANRNRFHIGAQLHFNVTADMKNLAVPANSGPDYDDGFVRNDSSDSFGGKSWNWGYSVSNQVIGASAPRFLELHGAPSPRDGRTDRLEQDFQYGFELGYGRELWTFGNSSRPTRMGIEASFAASALALDAQNTVSGTVRRRADRYAFGAVVPPNAPYSGSFEGPVPPNPPMPLIGTNIVSSVTTTETVTSTQRSEIEGTYWGFRLGPFAEIPLSGRFQLQAGAGLAVVQVDATLSYFESFTTTGLGGPPPPRTDSRARQDWLMGFYGEARLQYWINEAVALYVGGQFQALDDFKVNALDREATVDFGSSFGALLGVIYSF